MNQKKELYDQTLEVLRIIRYASLDAPSQSKKEETLLHAFDLTQFVIQGVLGSLPYSEIRAHIQGVRKSFHQAKPLTLQSQNLRKIAGALAFAPDYTEPTTIQKDLILALKKNKIDDKTIDQAINSNEKIEYISPLSTGYFVFSWIAAHFSRAFPEAAFIIHPIAISKNLNHAIFMPPIPNATKIFVVDDNITTGTTMLTAIRHTQMRYPHLPVYPRIEDLY